MFRLWCYVLTISASLGLQAVASTTRTTAMMSATTTQSAAKTFPLPNTCTLYPYNDTGACKEFLTDQYVFVNSKPAAGYLRANDLHIDEVFSRIKYAIGMLNQSGNKLAVLKYLLNMYQLFTPGIRIPADDVLIRITNQIAYVSDQCLDEMRELYCRTYFPRCLREVYKGRVYNIFQVPCQEMCIHIHNVTCSNFTDVLAILRELRLLDSLDCKFWSTFYQPGLERCYWQSKQPAPTQWWTPTHDRYSGTNTTVTYPNMAPTKQKSPPPSAFNGSLAEPSNAVEDFSSCPFYEDILPDGVCIEQLRGIRVAQSPDLARISNMALRVFYNESVPMMLSNFGESPRRATDLKFVNVTLCKDKPQAERLLRSVIIPSRKEAVRCRDISRLYGCEIYHPICLVDKTTRVILPSFPCKESCMELEELCPGSLQFMKVFNQVKQVCPALRDVNNLLFILPLCAKFVGEVGKKMEVCQMIPMKASESEKGLTYSCYEGIGLHYRGTLNTTASGRTCSLWHSMPFFDPVVYPSLDGAMNHCRNPQGYRNRPWCYVDVVAGEWEYCDLKLCPPQVTQDSPDSVLSKPRLWYLIAGCIGLLSMLSIGVVRLLVRRRISNQRNRGCSEPAIPVDYETPINVVGIKGIIGRTNHFELGAKVGPTTPEVPTLLEASTSDHGGDEILGLLHPEVPTVSEASVSVPGSDGTLDYESVVTENFH